MYCFLSTKVCQFKCNRFGETIIEISVISITEKRVSKTENYINTNYKTFG